MQVIDLIFILLLLVVQPVYGIFEARHHDAQEKAGQPLDRIKFYRQTTLVEWLFLAALAAAWLIFGRPVADLGFVVPGGAGFWGGAAFLILLTGFLLYSWQSVKKASDTEKAKHAESLGKLVRYVPHNVRELNSFVGVSVTAGIVEEIVYRGFMLW